MGNIILNENMGEAILARLRDFADLPGHGYVAGQSVASAVSELFGDGRAVMYNDVDVFRTQTKEELLPFRTEAELEGPGRPRRAIDTCDFTTMELKESYRQISECTVRRYKVLSTARKGLLNEVYCDFETRDPHKFLETFDMNCVQVGVDIETGKLFWTPEFDRFMRTRQLDVVTLHTPFHSLIRYFRKKEELEGVYGNDERIIELLAAAYEVEMGRANRRKEDEGLIEYSNLRWRFGRIYRDKLDKVAGKILPHFTIETEMVNDYPVSFMVPRFQAGKDLVRPDMPNIVHCLPKMSRALREKHVKGMQGRISYLADNIEKSGITRDFWLVKGDSYLKGNVTPAEMARMDKTVRSHAIYRHLEADTLGEQLEKFKRIRKEVSKRGLWVYGVMENSDVQQWTDETLSAHLDEEAKLLKMSLKKPTLPVYRIAEFTARELTTGMALAQEGAELHHCVGGYAKNIKGGYSRIISFRTDGGPHTWLTVELRRDGKGWYVGQNLGLQNRNHTEYEARVAKEYEGYTNLAAALSPLVARALIHVSPVKAAALGRKLNESVLKKLSSEGLVVTLLQSSSKKLAARFGITYAIRARNGEWYSTTYDVKKFWKEFLIQKWTGVYQEPERPKVKRVEPAPARMAAAGGAFAEMDDDLPF
jgi:hypothetical protein